MRGVPTDVEDRTNGFHPPMLSGESFSQSDGGIDR